MTEPRGVWSEIDSKKGKRYVYEVSYNGQDFWIKMGRSSKNHFIFCRNETTKSCCLRPTTSVGITNNSTITEVKAIIEQNMKIMAV